MFNSKVIILKSLEFIWRIIYNIAFVLIFYRITHNFIVSVNITDTNLIKELSFQVLIAYILISMVIKKYIFNTKLFTVTVNMVITIIIFLLIIVTNIDMSFSNNSSLILYSNIIILLELMFSPMKNITKRVIKTKILKSDIDLKNFYIKYSDEKSYHDVNYFIIDKYVNNVIFTKHLHNVVSNNTRLGGMYDSLEIELGYKYCNFLPPIIFKEYNAISRNTLKNYVVILLNKNFRK